MKIVLILLTVVFLSGCSLFNTKPIEVTSKPIERAPLTLPSVDQYQARNVEWLVVTPDNYQRVISELKKGSVALFAITPEGYENMALNASDLMKLIKQQKAVIAGFTSYYETTPTPKAE
jgi:hypothetical protein